MPSKNFNVPEGVNPEDHHLVSVGELSFGSPPVTISMEICGLNHDEDPELGISGRISCKVMAVVPVFLDPNAIGEPDSEEWSEALAIRAEQVTATLAIWGTEQFKASLGLFVKSLDGLIHSTDFDSAFQLAQAESKTVTRERLKMLQDAMLGAINETAKEAQREYEEARSDKPSPDSAIEVIKDLFGEDMTDTLKPLD